MRRVLLLLVLAALVTAGVVVAGTMARDGSGDGGGGQEAAEPYRTTPLSELDAATVAVARGPFCDDLDPRLVEATLGVDAASTRSWGDGDPVALGRRREDVGHEYGCEYAAADGSLARAWVYAPPVGADQAARLAKGFVPSLPGRAMCTGREPSTFGAPSATDSCLAGAGMLTAFGGLFGDAWVHCELLATQDDAEPGDPLEVEDRAGRWCVGVLEAASPD